MKKEIHTHCKYPKCGKKLPFPSSLVHYCRNNNKCKNDYHNSIRKAKTDLADLVIETTIDSYELEHKLNKLLNKRKIRIMPNHELELMGIELSSPLISLTSFDQEDLTIIEFEYAKYHFFYFVLTDEVGIWKDKETA